MADLKQICDQLSLNLNLFHVGVRGNPVGSVWDMPCDVSWSLWCCERTMTCVTSQHFVKKSDLCHQRYVRWCQGWAVIQHRVHTVSATKINVFLFLSFQSKTEREFCFIEILQAITSCLLEWLALSHFACCCCRLPLLCLYCSHPRHSACDMTDKSCVQGKCCFLNQSVCLQFDGIS